MALNFNVSPYFDDFDPSKNFHRILFKPGSAVQARELTQSQTILQNQISNFASAIYSTNTPISGGKVTTNLNCNYVKLSLQYNGQTIVASSFLNKIIQDTTGTVLARVIATTEATGTATNPGDPPTLVVSYLSGLQFSDGQIITTTDTSNLSAITIGNVGGNTSIGLSSTAGISNGVFYIVNGYSKASDGTTYSIGNFVNVSPQIIILDKYDNTPSARVGLQITETIYDYINDSSLLDPAVGASNYQAPGADRYVITLTLTTLPLTLGNDDGFIELLRIVNGQIISQTDTTVYSSIDDYFAKRDYETNGDYIVEPFTFTPSPNKLDSSNSTYNLSISKGVAYVHGYRIENQSPYTLVNNRARTINSVGVNDVYIDYGNYYNVDTLSGFFDITTQPVVDIHCVPAANINSSSANTYNSTLVGTAYIRGLQYVSDSGSTNLSTYVYRSYLSDLTFNTKIGSTTSATATTLTINDTGNNFSAVANAYTGMKLSITNGTDFGDIRNIISYSTGKTFTVDSPFTVTPDSTTQFTLLSDSTIVESIVQKNSSTYALTANVNINTASGKFNSIATGYSILQNPGTPEMIFTVGNPFVANLSSSSYSSTKNFRNRQFSSSGQLQLTISTGPLRFIGTGQLSDATIKQNITVINSATGKPLNITSSATCTVTVASNQQTLTIQCASYANYNVNIIVNVNVTNADGTAGGILKSKNLVTGSTSVVSTSGPSSSGALNGTTYVDLTNGQVYITNAGTGTNQISLYVTDVKRIVKIIDTGSPSVTPTLAMLSNSQYDVTNQYQLNNGQRDSHYDFAYIITTPGANPAKGNLLVIFDRYAHSGGDGYFSVLSYLSASDPIVSGGVSTSPEKYSQIGIYTATDGTTYRLADSIDFRPSRTNATTSLTWEYNVATSSDGGVLIPQNLTQFQSSYGYYLGRKDLLILTKDKSFQIISGTPSLYPIFPSSPSGSIILANLSHDPYTSYIPGENPPGIPASLSISTVAHNRWAKSDITDLQTRVNNLEYYTALSYLESTAASTQVPNTMGVVRPNYGILVDDFSSYLTADTGNSDYLSNINIRNQTLSPISVVDNFQLHNPILQASYHTISNTNTFAVSTIGTNAKTNVFTLPYTVSPIVIQALATSAVSLNPFAVTVYQGIASLFPSMDNWVDTNQAPALLSSDPALQLSQSNYGLNWTNGGDFATIPGTESTFTSTSTSVNHGAYYNNYVQTNNPSQVGYQATTTSTYASTIQNITTAVQTNSLPNGMGSNNGYINNISILPYIRPQQIGFNVQGLLVNTPVSVWFDGQNINQYITSPNTIELTGVTGTFKSGDVVGFYTQGNFYPTARVDGTYVYPGTTNVRLYVSSVLGAISYTTTNVVQNGVYNASGVYQFSTAKGTVNGASTAMTAHGQVSGVGGGYSFSGTTRQIYAVQDPHDWCGFLNQYGIWGDLNRTASYSASFTVTPSISGVYNFTWASTGTTNITFAGATVVSSGANYTSPSIGSYTVSNAQVNSALTLSWSVTGSSQPASGFALVVTDPNGNQVFVTTRPPNLTYTGVTSELAMPQGGAWFTGVTQLKLDQNAKAPQSTYYIGAKIQITSQYVYSYTLSTATYVPPPPAPSGGPSGKIICNKLAQLGYFDYEMNQADQKFGRELQSNDRMAYLGYIRWAQTVVDLMDGKGSEKLRKVILFWIKDEQRRVEIQQSIVNYYMEKLARPWAQEMAYRMGAKGYESNLAGKIIMDIGLPLCRKIGKIENNSRMPLNAKILLIWSTVTLLLASVVVISGTNSIINKIKNIFKKQDNFVQTK